MVTMLVSAWDVMASPVVVGRLGARSDADLGWEARLLQHLNGEDLTVPVPISTSDGQLLADGLVVMTYVVHGDQLGVVPSPGAAMDQCGWNTRWMKSPPLVLVAVAVSVGVTVSACGDSHDSRACATDSLNDIAEVCIVRSPSNLTIETSGLEPESELILTSDQTGEVSHVVAETGSLVGEVGFLGDFTGETITISGTWASGEQFTADIKIQP